METQYIHIPRNINNEIRKEANVCLQDKPGLAQLSRVDIMPGPTLGQVLSDCVSGELSWFAPLMG